MYAKSLLDFTNYDLLLYNTTINNIQTLGFNLSPGANIELIKCNISQIGTQIIYHLEDVPEHPYLWHFKDVLISRYDKDRFKVNGLALPNGLIRALGGDIKIQDSTVSKAISRKGLIFIGDKQNLNITNSHFSDLIGVEQSSFIFAIQNEEAHINFTNSTV